MITLALVIALQLLQTPSDQPRPATATIRGHVFAGDTKQPLRKAQVRLFQIDVSPVPNAAASRENRLATTDADGKYEFKDLPAGRFNLSASKGSYVAISWGQQQPNEPGKPLEILTGQTLERVDFTLPRGGVMTGRIVDELGDPMSAVQVATVRSQVVNGQRRMLPTGRSASTNDLGEFRLFGIMPGQYYLQATWRRMGPNDPSLPDRTGYPVTFFPGTADAGNAQRITVGAGQQISDLAMTMLPIKTARVEGTVVDSNGQPMAGVMLSVTQLSSDGVPMFGNSNLTRPDGGFTFASLAPGDYTLRTLPRPGEKESASMKISVGSADVKDLRLVASAPSTITGRVVVDPAEALSLPPALMIAAMSMDPTTQSFGNQPSRVGDDMSFELTAMPGKSRILMTNLPPAWTVRSVRINSTDVIDDGIDVKPNESVGGVEVELTTKVTSVSGLVTDERGDPVKEYTVVFFPADSKRWTPGSRYLRIARPDQEGRFKISGLPPGEYNAIALDKIDQGQSTDPEFLERERNRASTFTVLDGETRTVDLRLNSAS
jgi:protocatechuate 3,4-dioxygenase beta subunit